MEELFCVLHKDLSYSPEKTAGFLAVERCVSRVEAAAAFRNSPGFLLENASLVKASAFNLRASAFGFETLLLPQKEIKSPPPAFSLSKIEFKADGFYCFSNNIREQVPFLTVKAVTACALSVEIRPEDSDTFSQLRTDAPQTAGLKAGIINSLRARYFPFAIPLGEKYYRPALTPPAPARETVFRADILTGGPAPLRLTLACDGHDYSSLGAKKTLSSFENFRILLEELSSRTSGAVKNAFLRALLEKKTLGGLKFPSAGAYEKELAWLLTILP